MDAIEFPECQACRRPPTFCTVCFHKRRPRTVEMAALEVRRVEEKQVAAQWAALERDMFEQARERERHARAAATAAESGPPTCSASRTAGGSNAAAARMTAERRSHVDPAREDRRRAQREASPGDTPAAEAVRSGKGDDLPTEPRSPETIADHPLSVEHQPTDELDSNDPHFVAKTIAAEQRDCGTIRAILAEAPAEPKR